MFGKLLIANRGEIAVRIARTARRLGIAVAAIYSDADRQALHVAMADEAYRVGPPPASESYLDAAAIIAIARGCGAEAIHPGYGFLAENADFAQAVTDAGIAFIGPPAAAIRAMGLKDRARTLMMAAGVPVLPGTDDNRQDTDHLASEALRIGYPVLIKPVAGGGGKGMRRIDDPGDFAAALAGACREALSAFGNANVLIEKYLARARHIEIQIFADSLGNTIQLFERDCSLQRRHQKVIEEAPAPGMTEDLRARMGKAAVDAAKAVGYTGAGTVEFIADVSDGLKPDRFYFMEMNTRLQVEHPVTEMITGLDLVEWQLRVASGEPLPLLQSQLAITGHAVEARLYAEDPARDFQPQTGTISHLQFPVGVRVDSGVRDGDAITPHYDPMIAKLIAHGPNRAVALRRLAEALAGTRIGGCRTNLAFLNRLVREPAFVAGASDTGFIARHIDRLAKGGEPPVDAIAAALLYACGHLAMPAGLSPFDTLINFRLWPGEVRTIGFTAGGMPLEASLMFSGGPDFELRQAGQVLPFSLLDHDGTSLRLLSGGRIARLTFFHHDNVLTVGVDGAIHEFAAAEAGATASDDDAGSGLVIVPVPGVVSVVSVKPGAHVSKGDIIAVTEAMKMEFALVAPRSGRVAMVHVKVGDLVEEGSVIAAVEDSDG